MWGYATRLWISIIRRGQEVAKMGALGLTVVCTVPGIPAYDDLRAVRGIQGQGKAAGACFSGIRTHGPMVRVLKCFLEQSPGTWPWLRMHAAWLEGGEWGSAQVSEIAGIWPDRVLRPVWGNRNDWVHNGG